MLVAGKLKFISSPYNEIYNLIILEVISFTSAIIHFDSL
jgi:hypothetical protein